MPKAPRQFTLTCWWSVLLSFICVFDRVHLAVLHFPPTEEWAHTKPSSPVCLAAGHGLVHKGFAFSSSESQLRCGQAKSRGLGGQSGWWLRKILSVVSDLQAGRTDWTGKMEGWNENLFGKLAGITVSEWGTRQEQKIGQQIQSCGNRHKTQPSLKHAIITESASSHACEGLKLATLPTVQKLYSGIYYY